MGMSMMGDWNKAIGMFGGASAGKGTFKKGKEIAMKRALAFFEGKIKRNIKSGGNLAGKPFLALADMTIKKRLKKGRKSKTPLVETGDMLDSVHSHPISPNEGFVGLKRGEVHKTGGMLADIAEIHEFGGMVKGHEIPARPFIGPVLKKFKREMGEKYGEGLQAGMGQ